MSRRPSKILIVHNTYQQRGGEDAVVETEKSLLNQAGVEAQVWLTTNAAIGDGIAPWKTALDLWRGGDAALERELEETVRGFRPELLHIHNVFPRIVDGAYRVAERAGIPVVQTVHNYRFACANAQFLRDAKPCELCLTSSPLVNAVAHSCYRGSRPASLAVAGWITQAGRGKRLGERANRIIALTEFARGKLIAAGAAPEKIVVKPNGVLETTQSVPPSQRSGVLSVGRLSFEKGIHILLRAARMLPNMKFRIGGDGPERVKLQQEARDLPNVEWLGSLSAEQVNHEMRAAAVLAFPSIWYEGFPMVLGEALRASLPVACSRMGGLPEIIRQGVEGLLHEAGNAEALAQDLEHLTSDLDYRMRARQRYEMDLAREPQTQALLSVYASVLAD